MRLTLFMILFFFTTANAFTQKISLSVQSATLNEVLRQIKDQAGVQILYNAGLTKQVPCRNLVMANLEIEAALQKALDGTSFNFFEENGVYIIRESSPVGQENVVTIGGMVTDKNKQPLPGVSVVIVFDGEKSGKYMLGTVTNGDGVYRISLPAGVAKGFSLRFTFIGMEPQVIKYNGQEKINISMNPTKEELEEVIVTGYGKLRKESFTGTATTVTQEDLLKTNNKNVISALQNFDPSFRIKENSLWGSDPNALPEFNIRGESSMVLKTGLDAEQERRTQRTNLKDNPNLPIFILDGFETSVQKIYDMDINRIESMTILKDAAATAMYGSRAANGVVVVTTIAPKPGEMRLSYNISGGIELPDLSDYNLCNAQEKLEVEKLAGKYTSADPDMEVYKQQEYYTILNNILRGVNTDWLALPLRNAFNHTHSLNVQGGVESIRYSLDCNYDSNNGAMKDSHRSRAGAGLTLDFRNKKGLQVMNSVSYNVTWTEDSPYGDFSEYSILQPYNAIYDEDGKLLAQLVDKNVNPLWRVENLNNFTGKGQLNDITDNLSINLSLLDGLTAKVQFSMTKTESKTETFRDPKDPEFNLVSSNERGTLSRFQSKTFNWNLNAMVYYNKMLGKHFVNATAGMNMKEAKSENMSMLFKGFQLGSLHTPAFAASQPNKTDVSSTGSRLIGFLGSVNYSYDNIYLLDASFRLDGSSQFGVNKRYAPFWSMGLGVNMHRYSFLRNNRLISQLKVRGSYGSTGKVNFPAFSAITTYQTSTDKWYFTGPATTLAYLGNPNLTWEKTNTIDAGVTIGLLKDRFYLEFNYYHKETNNALNEMSIRTSSGFDKRYSNLGSILNEGFEVRLNATVFRNKDWNVSVNANLASNKNTITSLSPEVEAYNKKLHESYDARDPKYADLLSAPLIQYYKGASMTAIYAVRSLGIDPANGRELFVKKDGSITHNWCADDQVVVGDNSPTAQGAFGVNVAYKGFYLTTSFLYQWGAQAYNKTLLFKVENADIDNNNVDRRVLTQRWIKAGDIAPYYDMRQKVQTNPTSRFVQDYNYLNFSSLSFGYDFSQTLIKKIRLTNLGIRFNANELCRWSSVKEERGLSYPFAKNYSFTLNIGF